MQEKIKFEMIQSAILKENNVLTVSRLCDIAGVSRSGYYAWIKSAPRRVTKEEQDKRDFERIVEAYKFRGYTKGARGIYMRLLHTSEAFGKAKRNFPILITGAVILLGNSLDCAEDAELKEQAADMDGVELMDARLNIRNEQERSAMTE